MAKYISNKKNNPKSSNDLEDFNSISDVVWNFLSSVYQSSWNSLYTDNHSKSLREKILAKLTLRVVLSTKNKTTKNPNPVTINKALPLPPLLAKSKKEVNIISKYFLPNKPLVNNNVNDNSNNSGKSYAQATKSFTNTLEVLKIKETFPSLNAQKVDQVQNIVNGQARPKPRIKMITKGPSRKQVIISMSGENISSFMKSSSLHVANLNRLLCNAKSEVLTDYICADSIGITIVTNKVSQQSDMAIINNYIKSLNDINSLYGSLLFLLPPSCMVASIGKSANKFSFSTHFNSPNTDSSLNTSSLPPMSFANDLGMDIQQGFPLAINSEARGRNPSLSANSSRESSLASSGRATPYHDRMDVNVAPRTNESNSESLELSYETTQEQAIRVSMAANQQVNQQVPTRPLDSNNEATPTHG